MKEVNLIPRTKQERDEKTAFIRKTVETSRVGYVWLVQELEKEGFRISNTTVSSIMSGALVSPKGDEFLLRAYRICQRYETDWNGRRQSGT